MRKSLFAAAALAVSAFALAPAASAQNLDQPVGANPADEGYNLGGVAVEFNTDITTAYFFRGIIQEDQGVIVQPSLELGIDVTENDQVAVGAYVGIWNSFHSEQTGTSGSNEIWYEADLYGGLSFDLGNSVEGLSADIFYTAYTSPNGAFDTVQEIAVAVGYEFEYNDVGIATGLTIAREIDGAADGTDPGWYAEVGVEPSFDVDIANTELTIAVPVTLGFSIDDYYEFGTGDNDALGFVSVGVATSYSLADVIDSKYGDWSVGGSITGLFLVGDNLEDVNSDDEFELIGTVGINMTY